MAFTGSGDVPEESKLDSYDENVSTEASTPEVELDTQPQPAIVKKRKGGRKPIYATSEERKQRNRQAQAAFRERRTEHIRLLEISIQENEDALRVLQQEHQAAIEECLVLKYRNSLLERIIIEKGFDLQAEMQARGEEGSNGIRSNIRTNPRSLAMQQAMHARRNAAEGQTHGFTTPEIRSKATLENTQASGPARQAQEDSYRGYVSPASPYINSPMMDQYPQDISMSVSRSQSFPSHMHHSQLSPLPNIQPHADFLSYLPVENDLQLEQALGHSIPLYTHKLGKTSPPFFPQPP